jgi:hypothetical protein
MTKICSGCGRDLDLSFFHKHKKSADGLRRLCKDCISEKKKQYYWSNREKILTKQRSRQKVSYHKNQDKIVSINPKINLKKAGNKMALLFEQYLDARYAYMVLWKECFDISNDKEDVILIDIEIEESYKNILDDDIRKLLGIEEII